MYYCNLRYYSPKICRFIQQDNVEYLDLESFNGLNLYCYCMNNPISYYDPSGHSGISFFDEFVKKLQEIIAKLTFDLVTFDFYNTSEQVVIDSNYFSFYKGAPVIKHYIKMMKLLHGLYLELCL